MYKITVYAKSHRKALKLKKLIAGCKYSAIESKINIKPGEIIINKKYILEFTRLNSEQVNVLVMRVKNLPGVLKVESEQI